MLPRMCASLVDVVQPFFLGVQLRVKARFSSSTAVPVSLLRRPYPALKVSLSN